MKKVSVRLKGLKYWNDEQNVYLLNCVVWLDERLPPFPIKLPFPPEGRPLVNLKTFFSHHHYSQILICFFLSTVAIPFVLIVVIIVFVKTKNALIFLFLYFLLGFKWKPHCLLCLLYFDSQNTPSLDFFLFLRQCLKNSQKGWMTIIHDN